MSGNPEMLTHAKHLRARFIVRLVLYAERAAEAKMSYADTRTPHSKHVFEVNRQAMIAVIACYGDATNMTFKQAQTALGVSDAMLEKLS